MKICIIALNKNDYAPQRILESGKKNRHTMHLATWNEVSLDLDSKKIKFVGGKKNLDQFDAIIVRNCKTIIWKGKEKITLHRETLLNLLIEFSRSHKIYFLNQGYLSDYQSQDKLSQQYFLFQNRLPGIPSAYFFENSKTAPHVFPLVSKIADGSLGKQVSKIKDDKQLNQFLADRKRDGEFFLFQKFCPIKNDYRVLVVRERVLGVMKRTAQNGEWRTNFSLGGTTEKGENTISIEKLALKTAKKMKLDYAGIDILEYENKLHIIEINSFAQFKGFEKTFPDVDVAKEIIELVERKVQILKSAKRSKANR
jgi:ribosomal protein S6--L-glutamate ligase